MINNRQGGRRRGRNNNPRGNTGGNRGGGDSANRIDNRARGNATQLLEKYKNMARDAQMQGDRVQSEYYLQFADHYFRVQNDFKQRQDEAQAGKQTQHKPRHQSDNHDDGDDDGDSRGRRNDRSQDHNQERSQRPRQNRDDDDQREGQRTGQSGEIDKDEAPRKVNKPRAKAKPAKADSAKDAGHDDGALDASVLPPSLSASIGAGDDDAADAKPRRTRRKAAPKNEAGDSAAA